MNRIAHVVEHAAGDNQVVVDILLFKPWHEIAEMEFCPTQIKHLLGYQASQVGSNIGLDCIEDRWTVLLEHRGMRGFERPQFEHPFAGKAAELLDRPMDAQIVV